MARRASNLVTKSRFKKKNIELSEIVIAGKKNRNILETDIDKKNQ